jgi:glycosyltransferase involved in cell wall biosynthesis
MLLSVIITTYNRPQYLKQCLQSVFVQEAVEMEVIVVDDGTPGEANANICATFPGVTYLKIPNSGGPARPRNIGYEKSRGDFIAFLDDDDQWLPLKSAKQIEILATHPEFVLVHSPMKVIREDGSVRDEICGEPGTPGFKHGWVFERMVGNFTLMMPTVLFKRYLFVAAGGFDETLPPGFEDIDFWTRCSFFGPFFYQAEITAVYRATDGGLSRNNPLIVNQPLYLLKGINQIKSKITKHQYKRALQNLIVDQIRRLNINFFKAFFNLFKISSFWFISKRNFKSFALEIYRLVFTDHYKVHAGR